MNRPNASDYARATAFVDGEYRLTVCPVWFANHRENAIRQAAFAEMQKRQASELRAAVEHSQTVKKEAA